MIIIIGQYFVQIAPSILVWQQDFCLNRDNHVGVQKTLLFPHYWSDFPCGRTILHLDESLHSLGRRLFPDGILVVKLLEIEMLCVFGGMSSVCHGESWKYGRAKYKTWTRKAGFYWDIGTTNIRFFHQSFQPLGSHNYTVLAVAFCSRWYRSPIKRVRRIGKLF